MRNQKQQSTGNTFAGIRPEIELVLALLRPSPGHTQMDRGRRLLHEQLDASYLTNYTIWHRVLPLVHRRLIERYPVEVPEELRTKLQERSVKIARTNLLLTSELLRLAGLFREEGIDLLPYKGPLLSYRLYGDVSLRPFTDLDLLVRRCDVGRAQKLLLDDGYGSSVDVPSEQMDAFIRYERDRPFAKEEGLNLELHWMFFDRYVAFPLSEEEIWGRLRTVSIGGIELKALPPEEEMLILALHGARHFWGSLGWLLDLSSHLRVHSIDWDRLAQLARRTGTRRILQLALRLATEYFGADLSGVHTSLSGAGDRRVERLASVVRKGLLEYHREQMPPPDSHRFYLRSRERMSDRLFYLWFWLFTPNIRDVNFIPALRRFTPLHYLVRPIRLMMRK